ncbi:MAG: carbamoyl phosphate synthase large subunit, partial [Acidobacteriota bacterium]
MINSNPASVSSDSRFSDRLYISPITVEDILGIYKRETPVGLIAQFGGKNASNICQDLEAAGVSILGTPPDTLKFPKNRGRFFDLMETLGIPHPESATAHSLEEAKTVAERIGYPVMLRPSRVPAKASIEIAHDQEDLILALEPIAETMSGKPIMINKFLENALEVEADALSDSTDVFIPSIMEHIELTGVH